MQPLISFIVSVYNTEDYVGQCIASVISQTYQNWELIIIDDGSTDSSPAICDQYAENEARIIVIHKQNTGQSDSRNLALKEAKGELISFIDSDDWIDPDFCITLLNAIEQTGKDCATCGYLNEYVGEPVYDPVSDFLKPLSSSEAIAMIYDRRLYGFLHGRLYRRHLLFDSIPLIHRYEDFAVIYKWLSHGNGIVLCPQLLYHYRQRQSSIMNSKNDHMFGYVGLLEECYQFVEANHLLPNELNKRIAVRNCIRIAKDLARRTRGQETKERLEYIREVVGRLQPVRSKTIGNKCFWRMHLLLKTIKGFYIIMRMSSFYNKSHKKDKHTYFK